MLEVEVHQQLHAFLKEQGEPYWPHHLTIARLVARALRLHRSALIQVGSPSGYQGRYRLSYLASIMIWPQPVLLVAPEVVQQRLLRVEIPRLCEWMQIEKPIQAADHWPAETFPGVLLTTPQAWLQDYLQGTARFPIGVPTILDGADDLLAWMRQQLTLSLRAQDWDDLMLIYPHRREQIRDVRIQLTQAVFRHPVNPYGCTLMDQEEQQLLNRLHQSLQPWELTVEPLNWQQFWQQLAQENRLAWAEVNRQQGHFSLHSAPVDLQPILQGIWNRQPMVLFGHALDQEADARLYRQQVGLSDLTCVKFSPDRQAEAIQLYLPDGIPLPNTPQFQRALIQQIHGLLLASRSSRGLTVLIIDDLPLKAQIASHLAAEFGSRVQVETLLVGDNSILITGWEFWQQQQQLLPPPDLLAIATLPLPSLEDPRVAGRVAYYKHLRQDWFRLYLLPEALNQLQRAIAPVRERQGVVALLDSRVLHRSYGQQVLAALSPYGRVNYLDTKLFAEAEDSLLEQF